MQQLAEQLLVLDLAPFFSIFGQYFKQLFVFSYSVHPIFRLLKLQFELFFDTDGDMVNFGWNDGLDL